MSRRTLCHMTQPDQAAAKARSLGLALLDASRIYEGFVIPSWEGHLRRRRRFPLIGGRLSVGYDDTAEPSSGEEADIEDLFEASIGARDHPLKPDLPR
jgi:hypothetical protein